MILADTERKALKALEKHSSRTTAFLHAKTMNPDPYLMSDVKINSKWIKELNIRAKTIKLLAENIGVTLHDLRQGSGSLDLTPKA